MIEEVKDFFGDVKESVGDKGFYILIAGVVALFIYFLMKDNNTATDTEVYYSPSGVDGYPDVGTNSEVIADSVNKTIDSFSSEILDVLQSTQDSITNIQGEIDKMQTEIDEKFDATNDYINEGLSKWEDITEKIETEETQPSIMFVEVSPNGNKVSFVNKEDLTEGEQKNIDATINPSVTTTTTATTTPNATTKTDGKSYYTYKTKSGLNTSTSIVDGLKAIGVDSSMENRKVIAEYNGISNYRGTYEQNVQMLNKLKSGTLAKPTETKTDKTETPKTGKVITATNSGLAGISSILYGG